MTQESRPVPLTQETMASNPGQLAVQLGTYVRCFPKWPVIWAVLLVTTALLGLFVHTGFWVGFVLVLALVLFAIYRLNQWFVYGCVNPAKVVSVSPYLIAVMTDLRTGPQPFPVIKILGHPLEKMTGGPPSLGTRLATVAMYMGDINKPHWDTFEPVVTDCVTSNRADLARVLSTISPKDWMDLEEGLAQVPKPYAPGQHPVRYPTLFPGWEGHPPPTNTCTLFVPALDYAGLLEAVRMTATHVDVVGPETQWSQVVVHGQRSTLYINALPYQTPGDAYTQVYHGMYGYFSNVRTQAVVNQQRVLAHLQACRAAVGFVASPGFEEEDGHYHCVFQAARRLNGLVFNGNGMLDPWGRAVLNGDGSAEV